MLLNGRVYAYVDTRSTWEISSFSIFFCEPVTGLKSIILKIIQNTKINAKKKKKHFYILQVCVSYIYFYIKKHMHRINIK